MPSKPIAPIEIGSFTASTPHKTEFIGSASGVFFVNTVFRAFARSTNNSKTPSARAAGEDHARQNDPGSVDSRLVDPETPHQGENESLAMRIHIERDSLETASSRSYGLKGHGLGMAPDHESAKELLMLYLRNWHPLFPFLHGPTLLETIAALYETHRQETPSRANLRTQLCQVIICQCVFNIAAIDWEGRSLPPESQIESPNTLLALLGYVASNHDTHSLQALVAAQLFLVSTMSLRAASTVGGTLSRVMYHAGFHRCPYRYPQVPPQECDLRKRVFWTAYVLDRYLSQALGHPLGIQDSDLDVCIPGMQELHRPVKPRQQQQSLNPSSDDDVLAHLPRGHSGQVTALDENEVSHPSANTETSGNMAASVEPDAEYDTPAGESNNGTEILGHYVLYCRLTGQALEMFHKSLQNRKINIEDMIELQSNVHAWWNSLPRSLQDEYSGGKMGLGSTFTFFFIVLYNQLLLLTNRPFLSLAPKSLEFRSSLQTCVTASRQIITTLQHQVEWGLVVSWPGRLSVTWMAGLVLSFATTLKLYPFSKAQREIEDCIQQIAAMDKDWNNARHCAEALRSLLENLKKQYNDTATGRSPTQAATQAPADTFSMATGTNVRVPADDPSTNISGPSRKRRKPNPHHRPANTRAGGSYNSANQTPGPTQPSAQNPRQDFNPDLGRWPGLDTPGALPILEYTGPDFVFGNPQFPSLDDAEYLRLPVAEDLYAENPGAFGNIGWEAMANGAGYMNDWGPWSNAKF